MAVNKGSAVQVAMVRTLQLVFSFCLQMKVESEIKLLPGLGATLIGLTACLMIFETKILNKTKLCKEVCSQNDEDQ